MRTRVDIAPAFKRALKRLARKYRAVLDEVDLLITALETGERPGDKIPQVGYDVYKMRLQNPSAGRGKSGDFRAIYYIRLADHIVLLTIYSKSKQVDIPLELIRRIIQDYEQSQ